MRQLDTLLTCYSYLRIRILIDLILTRVGSTVNPDGQLSWTG
jgi:hypothetical protein